MCATHALIVFHVYVLQPNMIVLTTIELWILIQHCESGSFVILSVEIVDESSFSIFVDFYFFVYFVVSITNISCKFPFSVGFFFGHVCACPPIDAAGFDEMSTIFDTAIKSAINHWR